MTDTVYIARKICVYACVILKYLFRQNLNKICCFVTIVFNPILNRHLILTARKLFVTQLERAKQFSMDDRDTEQVGYT